jgi:class 3 adenylate cyclase
MVEAVRRYEGYVVQSTGDGIFALFGAPAAYEGHPQRSLYAALQMQQKLREYAQHLVSQGKSALEARFGVNRITTATGPIRRPGGSPFVLSPN